MAAVAGFPYGRRLVRLRARRLSGGGWCLRRASDTTRRRWQSWSASWAPCPHFTATPRTSMTLSSGTSPPSGEAASSSPCDAAGCECRRSRLLRVPVEFPLNAEQTFRRCPGSLQRCRRWRPLRTRRPQVIQHRAGPCSGCMPMREEARTRCATVPPRLFCNPCCAGQPIIYPRNHLSYVENLMAMMFAVGAHAPRASHGPPRRLTL